MNENRVIALQQKGAVDDPLTGILRTGARRLIAQAVEAEFETFLASNAEFVLSDGRQRVVRHGHDPVRAIQNGDRPGRSAKAEGPRSWRDRGRADTLHFEYPAEMGAAHEEPRCSPATRPESTRRRPSRGPQTHPRAATSSPVFVRCAPNMVIQPMGGESLKEMFGRQADLISVTRVRTSIQSPPFFIGSEGRHLYRGSLQLLDTENEGGTRSFPQILFPARRG
jgi:hypothetical protein